MRSYHRGGSRRLIVALAVQFRDRFRVAAVADGDGKVSPQSSELGSRHRAPLEKRAQLEIGSAPEIDEAGHVEPVAWLPR